MAILYFTFILVYWIASPGTTALAPETLYEAGFLKTPPPQCRERTWYEFREQSLPSSGKASTWSLSGEYICEQKIFNYGERNPYWDFVLSSASQSAKSAAIKIRSFTKETMDSASWAVRTEGIPPEIASRLHQTFRHELSLILAEGEVLRYDQKDSANQFSHYILVIGLRETDDPSFLFDLSWLGPKGRQSL